MEIPAECSRTTTYFRRASSTNLTIHDTSKLSCLLRAQELVLISASITKQTSSMEEGTT